MGEEMNWLRVVNIGAFILCTVIEVSAQHLHFGLPFSVSIDDKDGFMDSNCHMVVPARYDEALDFSEGLAAVKIGEKWGYIDQTGVLVIPAQFANAFYFSDGLASVRLDERSPLEGFIDKTGKVVIQPQFGMPLLFSEGLVEGYGEKDGILNIPLGYMDKNGKYTIRLHEPGMEIEFLIRFSEGLARVSMRARHPDGSVGPGMWGYIDHTGKWVIRRSFALSDDFHEGLAAVAREDGIWGYIDKTGQFAITPRFESANEFSEGLAAVRIGGRWGWINSSGQMVIAPKFEEVGDFHSGMALIVHNRNLVGYVNTKGEIVVPPELNYGSDFSDGVAAIHDGSSYGLIDTTGKVLCRLRRE